MREITLNIESLKRALDEVTEFRKNGPKKFKKLEDLLATNNYNYSDEFVGNYLKENN